MKAEFTIPGEPKGKGRHRTTHTQGGKAIQYTPKGTRLYEETVANEYLRQCGNVRVGGNEYVKADYTTVAEKVDAEIQTNANQSVIDVDSTTGEVIDVSPEAVQEVTPVPDF